MDQNAVQFRIGEAALQSGVSAANIRYYEKEGLLPPGVRGDNSYRLYSGADVHQLRFIRPCRAMDMTLDDHLQHVRARLAELQTLEADLLALRNRCDGTDAHCHIIEALHARADAQPAVPFATAAAKRHV